MKVSVIVPVYNTPPHLLKCCLSSVSSQKDVVVETVLVDDGSSPKIAASCEEAFINCGCSGRVVHQENRGLSGARNSGVDAATGDAVFFLDSDDHLADCTSIARLAARAEETDADVVVGRFHLPDGFDCSPARGRDWLLRCVRCGEVSFAAPDTLYKRARCVEERFELGLVHEDEDFSPRILFGSRLVAGCEGAPTYVRVPSEGSITTATSEEAAYRRCRGKFVVCKNSLDDLRFSGDPELWSPMQARAFGFANMAFLAWARSSFASKYERELISICSEIDWSRCRVDRLDFRNVRTRACMGLVRLLGPKRYVRLLRYIFTRGDSQ